MQLDEIRLNSHYATLGISEYKEGEDQESTPIINKRIIRTSELLEKLNRNVKIQPAEYKVDHLFPPNCRYYEKHPEGHLVVIEEPPAYRTIAVDKDMSNEIESLRSLGKLEEYGYENWLEENPKKPYMFNLAMPYAIFVFAYNNSFDLQGGRFFLRTQPISGFNDPVCKAPLLNINEGQSVCFGDRIYKGPKRSIFADVSHSIGVFWSTIFNPDYIYNYIEYQEVAGVCDYLTWEHYSHTDPMFIYNVDWIKADRTIGEYIDEARQWVLRNSDRAQSYRIDYFGLANLFDQKRVDEEVKVPGVDAKEPLLYDVCQYLFLGDHVAYLGDSFIAKDQLHFIDSFLGFRKMVEPSYVNIQREDGKIFRMRLRRSVRNYLEEKIKDAKFESSVTLENGVTLRPGDIMIMKNRHGNEVYRKINYLRQSQDGEYIEGRFGSEFYIIDNLPPDVSILDMSNPEYKGIKLIKDKEYFVVRSSGRSGGGPIISVSFAKFNEVTTGRRSNLIAKLTESQGPNLGYEYSVNFSGGASDNQRIFETDGIRELPEVFRLGRRLVYARSGDRYHNEPTKAYVLPNSGIAVPYSVSLRRAGSEMIRQNTFVENDVFKISSWDMDIEFQVGDKVVAADWQNPINMLTVKQIAGFVHDTDYGNVSFALSDKNGNPSSYPYVNGRNGYVLIGSIRKITNKWEELSAGMKIVAKEARISMFPKKDANIIIGFLYDTGGPEPLVLCSNACTLWYSDVIEKFDIISMTDNKWKGLEHAPINPSKMRIQAGDIVQGKTHYRSNGGYFAFRPTDSRTIRAQQMRYYGDYIEGYSFDRRFTRDVIFDAILTPRLTTTQENEFGFISALPNFHGMYTQTRGLNSGYLFPNDPRSILNVPNSSE